MSGAEVQDLELGRMPLLEHLRELRTRLIISMVALAVSMVLCLLLVDPVYGMLTAPVRMVLDGAQPHWVDPAYTWLTQPIPASLREVQVKGTLAITASPMEGVYTWFRVAIIGGAVVASPVIAFQVWGFVAPGLYKTERKVVLPLAAASSFLFALGALFAYAVILPVALPFFLQVLPTEAVLSIDGYLKTIVRMMIAFGACFQLPVASWFLARLGLIDHKDMIKGFRYAVVGIFAVAAIITPPDVITQTLLGIPLILLYGISILIVRFSSTKQR